MPARGFASSLIVALLLSTGIPHAGAQQSGLSEFPVPTANALLQGIVTGPDGNLWVAERRANAIARVTPSGSVTEFPLPNAGSEPFWLAVGSDGALWFTEISGNRIGRMTVDGSLTEYSVPTAASQPTGIVAGPDGALWFTERTGNRIGRITTGGVVTEYPLTAGSGPYAIAAGADGALWFTEQAGNRIGRITTEGVVTDEWTLRPTNRLVSGIAQGPDGAMWFVERQGQAVGRITADGTITKIDFAAGSNPMGITAGPDGNLYVTEVGGNRLARVTPDGDVTEIAIPTPVSQPFAITPGPGGLWFTQMAGNQLGHLRVVTDDTPPVVTISSPLDGALVTRGAELVAGYACADEEDGSGVVVCDGDVAAAGMLDTSTVGTHTFTVTAEDASGNAVSASAGYMVVERVDGRLAPLPAVTTVKAGTAVQVGLDLGVAAGRELMAPGSPASEPVSCADPSQVTGASSSVAGTVNVGASGHVELVWKTDKAWEGTCRRLVVRLAPDGWNSASATFLVRFG